MNEKVMYRGSLDTRHFEWVSYGTKEEVCSQLRTTLEQKTEFLKVEIGLLLEDVQFEEVRTGVVLRDGEELS
jgi:hypothetical protein